jgi:hypothetical protein
MKTRFAALARQIGVALDNHLLWSDAENNRGLRFPERSGAHPCFVLLVRISPLLIFGSKGSFHAGTARLSEPKVTFRPSQLTSKKSLTPVMKSTPLRACLRDPPRGIKTRVGE